jgi:hypothetical protein
MRPHNLAVYTMNNAQIDLVGWQEFTPQLFEASLHGDQKSG